MNSYSYKNIIPYLIVVSFLFLSLMLGYTQIDLKTSLFLFLGFFTLIRLIGIIIRNDSISRAIKSAFYFYLAILLYWDYNLVENSEKFPEFEKAVALFLFVIALLEFIDLFFETFKDDLKDRGDLSVYLYCFSWQLLVIIGIPYLFWVIYLVFFQ